jgi:hypothetical protein
MANYLNDSGTAKALLHHYQIEVYGEKLRLISVFDTNLFVLRSILRWKAALVQAASDSEWLSLGGKSAGVKEHIVKVTFWLHLKNAFEFLQLFSDMIHQIKADRPAYGRCYPGLMKLEAHVRNSVEQWKAAALCEETACKIARQTWERRLGDGAGVGRSGVQELLLPAYTLAFLFGPTICTGQQRFRGCVATTGAMGPWECSPGAVYTCRWQGCPRRAAGIADGMAASGMCAEVIVCADKTETTGAKTSCTTNHVAAVKICKGFWKCFGHTRYPFLSEVARAMSVHPTSAATEQNWLLLGRVYTSARNALGLERAKKMITFCFNDRAKAVD